METSMETNGGFQRSHAIVVLILPGAVLTAAWESCYIRKAVSGPETALLRTREAVFPSLSWTRGPIILPGCLFYSDGPTGLRPQLAELPAYRSPTRGRPGFLVKIFYSFVSFSCIRISKGMSTVFIFLPQKVI